MHVLLYGFIWHFLIWEILFRKYNSLSNSIWHEYVCSNLKIGPFWGVWQYLFGKKGVVGNLFGGFNQLFVDFCQNKV